MDAPTFSRRPLVVIAGQHSWLMRSLESIFASNGFTVVITSGDDLGAGGLPDVRPDLILLEADPPDQWAEMVGAIREQPGVMPTTPIVAATAEPLTRQKRLDALRSGAWDVFGHPLDAEVLALKAAAYVRSKMEADEARDRGLVDAETDLYNVRGVLRRMYEEASAATRHGRPLACLVAALDVPGGESGAERSEHARAAARLLRRVGRASDVLGRLGPNEFVVIAPGTDAAGAHQLAERLVSAHSTIAEDFAELPQLRAGYAAVGDVSTAEIEPVDLFVRAVVALRSAQAVGAPMRIRSFDG